jgi:hypothetical protein
MLLWFVVIALLGLGGIARNPAILEAVSPHYAVTYLMHAGPGIGFAVLGALSSLSRVARPCMRIWAILAGGPSALAGSLWSCQR